MTTGTLFLNLDLAMATSALVAMAMIAVPNLDRLRAFRLVLMRRRARHVREQTSHCGRTEQVLKRPAGRWAQRRDVATLGGLSPSCGGGPLFVYSGFSVVTNRQALVA